MQQAEETLHFIYYECDGAVRWVMVMVGVRVRCEAGAGQIAEKGAGRCNTPARRCFYVGDPLSLEHEGQCLTIYLPYTLKMYAQAKLVLIKPM